MMKIAFASGKGGTGKTTVAVNFAYCLAGKGKPVKYLDCDVEEPNGHIFLKAAINNKTSVKVMLPAFDKNKCTFCGKCGAACRFKAIVNLKSNVLIFPELCHACGLCVKVCPEGALREDKRETGRLEHGDGINGISLTSGILNVGEHMAGPVISAVKKSGAKEASGEEAIVVIDAPPGTSCSVVKTISDADFVVLVTEPTPFGLHDLKIAASVASAMKKQYGVVINRENGDFAPLSSYLSDNGIPLMMSLPEDREIAEVYSAGEIVVKSLSYYRNRFDALADNIGKLCGKGM